MTNLRRITQGFDVAPLLESIEGRPSLFTEQTFRQTYPGSAHRDTEAIFFRWAKINTPEEIFLGTSAIDQPAIGRVPEVKPLIREILSLTGANQWGRTLLVNLKPGGEIVPHIDEGKYADTFERFHLVLQSDPGNLFSVESADGILEQAEMKPGELWWFNHKVKHWGYNGSRRPRYHLIVDAVAPAWRRERE